jgi:hypothetical protein
LPATPPLDGKCPNCGADYFTNAVNQGIQPQSPDPRGPQQNPYSNKNPMQVPHNWRAASGDLIYDSKEDRFFTVAAKKEKRRKEHEQPFESEEFKQLIGPSDERLLNDDNKEVEQTMKDLAIDD